MTEVQKIAAPFELWNTVRIKCLENGRGMITGILMDNDGIQYRIVYWHDGQRRCEWMFAQEIAAVDG